MLSLPVPQFQKSGKSVFHGKSKLKVVSEGGMELCLLQESRASWFFLIRGAALVPSWAGIPPNSWIWLGSQSLELDQGSPPAPLFPEHSLGAGCAQSSQEKEFQGIWIPSASQAF